MSGSVGDNPYRASGVIAAAGGGGGGKILQVVSTTWDDNQTGTSSGGTFADITQANLAITPASTSNKVLVNFSISAGASDYAIFLKLQHNGTGSYVDIAGCLSTQGTGNRTNMTTIIDGDPYAGNNAYTYLDSPSKDSAFNYQVQIAVRYSAAPAWYVNYTDDVRDESYVPFFTSTLTLTEIDGT